MTNVKIRLALMEANLKQWQAADLLGIDETAFSRKLRYELPAEEQERIINIIRKNEKGENAQ